MATGVGASGGSIAEGSAPARVRLKATGLALGLPSLQSVVLDQIMPAAEDGCWTPGRDMVRPMLHWVCDTFAFETAYDLLQSFPRFCKYRNNLSCQLRTCENLLIDLFPERMDFTRKRRLHCSWVGENKDYTRDEWLQVLHQESRGRYEMEYRLLRRVVVRTCRKHARTHTPPLCVWRGLGGARATKSPLVRVAACTPHGAWRILVVTLARPECIYSGLHAYQRDSVLRLRTRAGLCPAPVRARMSAGVRANLEKQATTLIVHMRQCTSIHHGGATFRVVAGFE
jgi:hypothetical protein